jgi:phosphoribosylformimino-5-aminoimidazole carboxamide ribonucleotide (ProFAR) isomerase
MPIVASGGVKDADDIRKQPCRPGSNERSPAGAGRAARAGVIVGRSLYEGTLMLEEALAAAR